MNSDALARLTAGTSVRYAPHVGLEFTLEPPPADDVARAHVVAVTSAGDVVVHADVVRLAIARGRV